MNELEILFRSHHHTQSPAQCQPENTQKSIFKLILRKVGSILWRRDNPDAINDTGAQREIDCTINNIVNEYSKN